jgi:Holliday junction resolvase RusA-like endonuclease
MILFTLPIIPKAQARARHGRTKAGFSMTYKSAEQRKAEENLCALLLPFRPERPLEGPLKLDVYAAMPIPASWSKKRQEAAKDHREWPTGKPDLDNLVKHLKDCMTQVGFWRDDKQVVILEARKYYAHGAPQWNVAVMEVCE